MTILVAALSALGLGGLGVATYLVGPAAMLGFGKGVFGLLGKIPWQVWLTIAVALLLTLVIHDRDKWKDRATAYNAEAGADFDAAKTASGNEKLDRKNTARQILELGNALAATTKALNDQDAKIAALGKQEAAERQIAASAEKIADDRAKQAGAVSQRLAASSRSSARQTKPCEPSETLKEQWQ